MFSNLKIKLWKIYLSLPSIKNIKMQCLVSKQGSVLFKGNVKQGLETRWAVTLSSALSLLIVLFLAASV